MIPIEKVKIIIHTYETLEKELASGEIDKKEFVKKSKEYSIGLDLINRGSDLHNASEFTSFNSNSPFNPGSGGFGEDIPLSYQRMED